MRKLRFRNKLFLKATGQSVQQVMTCCCTILYNHVKVCLFMTRRWKEKKKQPLESTCEALCGSAGEMPQTLAPRHNVHYTEHNLLQQTQAESHLTY